MHLECFGLFPAKGLPYRGSADEMGSDGDNRYNSQLPLDFMDS